MATSSRDRISVDLRGLGARLHARAKMDGASPSAFVRSAVAKALDRSDGRQEFKDLVNDRADRAHRARLCLRMKPVHAALVAAGARQSGLNLGDYVGGLVESVPVLVRGGGYRDHIAELRSSNCEMATLSRNIHRLATLLGQGDLQQARPYREMLDDVAGEVRAHLELAARVLADLRPSYPASAIKAKANPAIRSR